MKAKIDRQGFLCIERAGRMEDQNCPLDRYCYCGDWCPLFGEPEHHQSGGKWFLGLCKKTLALESIIDEREKK